uniref:Uncharacterized protein n=1 Tax=Arundo donax TaxID=35708 RepID=A0A0A8ZAC0_ARUDO
MVVSSDGKLTLYFGAYFIYQRWIAQI